MSWGNLTEEKVALYLRDILEALHYLHSWRIAHLDLKVNSSTHKALQSKSYFGEAVARLLCFSRSDNCVLYPPIPLPQPENIVVEHASSQPVIKLTDFGDAVQLNPPSSYIHPLLGSPEFSAPELILGQPVSLTSDLWSLGV